MTIRSRIACRALVALLVLSGAAVPTALAQERMLAGQVVDERGEGVPDATIFVTRLGRARHLAEVSARLRAMTPAAEASDGVVKSGRDGTFSVEVAPGRYSVAVFKIGYSVALAEVNLVTRNPLQVLIREEAPTAATEKAAAKREGGLDWILRRSDGDELHELRAGLEGTSHGDAARAGHGVRMPPVNGELRQDFSGSDLLGGEAAGPGDASGRTTRLELRGAAGEEGFWRFAGHTGRTSAAPAAGGAARQDGTSSGVGGAFDYRLGPGDDLKTGVRYATSRYVFHSGDATDDIDQQQTQAALNTRWDKSLGDGAGVFVVGSYQEAAVLQPAGDQGAGEAGRLVDRSVGAAAGLAFRSDDHEVGMALRVHTYRYDLADGGALLYRADWTAVPFEQGTEGSAVTFSGGDGWRVADHHVLNYGIGYHNDFSSGTSYVVPRVGMTSTLTDGGDLVVRSAVMYRVEDGRVPAQAIPSSDAGDLRPQSARLGYEIGVTRRPEDRLQFAATLSYRPFQEGIDGQDAPKDEMLILSDATAGRHEMEFEVERSLGLVRGVFTGSIGRVQGRLSPVLNEGPVMELQTGQAHYLLTGLRATIQPTDTEVRIDYRRVESEAESRDPGRPASLDYRRLDLAVLQDLPISPFASSRWRVMMIYQGLLLDSADASAWAGPWAASRVSGGVEVSF
jgi:hypothetical protein